MPLMRFRHFLRKAWYFHRIEMEKRFAEITGFEEAV